VEEETVTYSVNYFSTFASVDMKEVNDNADVGMGDDNVDASREVAEENEDAGSEVDVESERKWGIFRSAIPVVYLRTKMTNSYRYGSQKHNLEWPHGHNSRPL